MSTPLGSSINDHWEAIKASGRELRETAIEAAKSEQSEIEAKITKLKHEIQELRTSKPPKSLTERFIKWISPDSENIQAKKKEINNLKLLNKKITSLNKNLSKTKEIDLDSIRKLSVKISDAIERYKPVYNLESNQYINQSLVQTEKQTKLSEEQSEFSLNNSLNEMDLQEIEPSQWERDWQNENEPIFKSEDEMTVYERNYEVSQEEYSYSKLENDWQNEPIFKSEDEMAKYERNYAQKDAFNEIKTKVSAFDKNLEEMQNDIVSNVDDRISSLMKNKQDDLIHTSDNKIINQMTKIKDLAKVISNKEANITNKKSFNTLFKKPLLKKEFETLEKELQKLENLKMINDLMNNPNSLEKSEFKVELDKLKQAIITVEDSLPQIHINRFKTQYEANERKLNEFLKNPSNLKQAKQLAKATKELETLNKEFDNIYKFYNESIYYNKSKKLLKDADDGISSLQEFYYDINSPISSIEGMSESEIEEIRNSYDNKERFSLKENIYNFKRWKVKRKIESMRNRLITKKNQINKDLSKAKTENEFKKIHQRCKQFLDEVVTAKKDRLDLLDELEPS